MVVKIFWGGTLRFPSNLLGISLTLRYLFYGICCFGMAHVIVDNLSSWLALIVKVSSQIFLKAY